MVGSQNPHATPLDSVSYAGWTDPPIAIVFDLADVLYDASIWSRWLVQVLHRLGLHTHYHAFAHVLEHDYLVEAYRGRRPYWHAFRDCLRSLGLSAGQVDEVLCTAQAGRRRFSSAVRPFPGVKNTLQYLTDAQVPMVVLANRAADEEPLGELLRRLGLWELLTAAFASSEIGTALPDPATYEAALDQLDLSPQQVVFVSHDRCELAVAAQLGLRTLAFNPSGNVAADMHIDRFEQLRLLAECATSRLLAG
jgi:FMN phosphatase YigB (HAD superfamily)